MRRATNWYVDSKLFQPTIRFFYNPAKYLSITRTIHAKYNTNESFIWDEHTWQFFQLKWERKLLQPLRRIQMARSLKRKHAQRKLSNRMGNFVRATPEHLSESYLRKIASDTRRTGVLNLLWDGLVEWLKREEKFTIECVSVYDYYCDWLWKEISLWFIKCIQQYTQVSFYMENMLYVKKKNYGDWWRYKHWR